MRRGKDQAMPQPHFIVFANEKGGTGKSTTAVHTAIALAASGHRVGALDLNSRQRTMTRYLENRSRTQRAKQIGKSVDWVVLRNRLQHIESHNLKRVGAAMDELAKRVGFRVIPGLGERVIYRELFPKGLTLLDLQQLGEVGIAHITARQELREMIAGLGIPGADEEQKLVATG